MTRGRFASASMIGAVVALCMAAYLYRPGSDTLALSTADLLLIVGLLLIGVALRLRKPSRAAEAPVSPQPTPSIRRIPLAIGIICLALLAERSGYLLQIPLIIDVLSVHGQFLLLVAGTLLVAVGLGGVRNSDLKTAWRWLKGHRGEMLLLAGIGLVALLLRVIDLENSVHTLVDEFHILSAINTLEARPFLAMLRPFDYFGTFTWVYPYWEMLSTSLFGLSLAGMRLPAAIVGTFTVIALYPVVRQLFNRHVAVLALILLATFPPHIHFSRLGLLLIADPLPILLGLACVIRALKTGNRRWYVFAGIALGWLAYFSEAGELLIPPVIVLWLLWMGLNRRTLRAHIHGIGWMLLGAFIIAAPVYYTALATQEPLLPRMTQVATDNSLTTLLLSDNPTAALQAYFRNKIMPPLLHLVHLPDSTAIYYAGDTGLILPFIVPFFLLGVGFVLWHPRSAASLLLIWLFLFVLGLSLIDDGANSSRYMVIAPALVMFTAYGLYSVVHFLMGERLRILFIAAICISIVQAVYYFGPHLARYREQVPPWFDYVDVAYRARDIPPDTAIYFIYIDVTYDFHFQLLFDFWELPPPGIISLRPHAMRLFQMMSLPTDRAYAFFIDPRDGDTIDDLMRVWNADGPYFSPYNIPQEKQYALFFAPPEKRRAVLPVWHLVPLFDPR